MRYEIRVIGSAGQGSILAAVVLATAAVEDDKYAAETATYGAAMRSGVSMGDVVISNEPIDFPKVFNLDAIIIQSQEAYDETVKLNGEKDIIPIMKRGGLVITDSDLVNENLDTTLYKVIPAPIARTATEKTGKRQVMNIVALGVFQAVSGLISKEAFLKAIEKAVPKRFIELNKTAFLEGINIAKQG